METQRTYIAIDLKSYFASVECVERGLDPLKTNLVVADKSRTEKTICLAVSPSLKSFGLPGRARLFEVVQKIKDVNNVRQWRAPNHTFRGSSYDANELQKHPEYAVDYIVASPRMSYYIKYSTMIYSIYLKYVAPEDIHVYSIDEVFIDATNYLKISKLNARDFAKRMIQEVYNNLGITATAGIGTNLYLCKIAMDIVAKHIDADEDGVRIAELDEMSYRKRLWNHTPLTDFWRVGSGTAKTLEKYDIHTMGDIAQCSIEDEDFLYAQFGVNAELLIDHAWGWEPCTISEIKAYKPETNSLSSGQVLHCPYDFKKARVVVQEMADAISLDLVDKKLVTNQLVLSIGYDTESLKKESIKTVADSDIATDYYGRTVPKPVHGTINLPQQTSSSKLIIEAVVSLYDKIVNPNLLIRRINITTNHVVDETKAENKNEQQLNLFSDNEFIEEKEKILQRDLQKERNIQESLLTIKKKFGKNAILKGLNYQEGATAKDRNNQIGGHKA